MLAVVKKLYIEENMCTLNKELDDLISEIIAIEKKINNNENAIKKNNDLLKKEKDRFFPKLISKFIIYKSKAAKKIEDYGNELNTEKFKLNNIKEELLNKKESLKLNFLKLKTMISANTTISNLDELKKMNLSFNDACELLKNHNIPIILDDSDLLYHQINSKVDYPPLFKYHNIMKKDNVNLSIMKNYVLVHKTNYFPINGRIKTSKEANVYCIKKFALNKLGIFNEYSARNTIHFAVNGEVASHGYGNWENCQCAILIPFPDMPINQFRCGAVMDTYIEGGLTLPKSAIILCPESQYNQVKENNPNQTVIGCKGNNITKFANAMVSYLGYKVEKIGNVSWCHKEDEIEYYKKLSETGLNIHIYKHADTNEFMHEKLVPEMNNFILAIKRIIDNNIALTEEDMAILMKDENIQFSIQSPFIKEIREKLITELAPYGIKIPNIENEKTNGNNLRLNLLNQTIEIVNNKLNSNQTAR